jgi:formyl-CoA transferase
MQEAVLNLCRVKLRDQQWLDHGDPLKEYHVSDVTGYVPRSGNASGGATLARPCAARPAGPTTTST